MCTTKQYRLVIIRQKYRFDGGAERFICRAIKALDNQNIEINLITRKWNDNQQKYCRTYICNPNVWSRISREKNFAIAASSIWKKEKFDIIQSHERIPGCNIYRAGDGVHCRWIIQRSKILTKWQRKMLTYSRYHNYVIATEKKMYQSPELKAVICNAEMIKKEIIEEFSVDAKKIHVIYNSVDSNLFVPASEIQRTSLRIKFNLPIKATILCFIGSNFERKGLLSAIKAIANTDVYLVVVGGKQSSSRHYVAFANSIGCQNQIRFLHAEEEILPFYQLSDGLLLPSLYDPFPNVILEAMACGLPVITSNNCCGGAEVIEQGRNGFLCNSLNINELKEAISEIIPLRKNNKMGLEARRKAKSFSPDKLSRQLITLYRGIFC